MSTERAMRAFHESASKKVKQLVSKGESSNDAVVNAIDALLIPHKNKKDRHPQQQNELKTLVDHTGFTHAQAVRTLWLRDEIKTLRKEGHNTAALIENLARRWGGGAGGACGPGRAGHEL